MNKTNKKSNSKKKSNPKKNKTYKKLPQSKMDLKQKKCFTNTEIANICKSGKYTMLDESIFSEKHIKELSKNPSYIKDPVKYRSYIIDEFKKISNKDLNYETKLTKKDFYSFINDEWINTKERENKLKYYVEVDNFRIMQEKVYYTLIDYMKKYIKENADSPKAKAIKNVYDSIQNNTIDSLKKHAKNQLNMIEDFFTKNEMYALIAHINKNEIISWGLPVQWSLLPDEKDVTKYISHISGPTLSIYDYLIYIDDPADKNETKSYKKMVKTHFLKYIDEVFTACLGKNHGFNPQDIWDIEYSMLDAMGCLSFKKDDPNGYNIVYAHEMESKFDFDWNTFSSLLGYKVPPKKIIVSSLNVFKCLTQLLKKNWNTPKWKTYWLYIHYRQLIRFESSLRLINFNFYQKILEGTPEPMPIEIFPIFALSMTFNTFLTEQYTLHNNNQLYVDYIKHIVHDLKYIFIRKLENNKWLSPKTKATAIKKLQKLTILVGNPGKLRADPILSYKNDDPWENMRLLTNWKHKQFIHLEGKPILDIPEIDWQNFKLVGTQNYMVNAYYRPTSNSIYVPGAYLQHPFIDLKQRGLEYNLAFIGYTIGHELSHSLDDMGSNYDENGNLNNWWTDVDRKKYKLKIKGVVDQYEEFAKRDGIIFDANLGVGEDLADINGMSLAEEYLIEFNKSNNILNRLNKISLEMFYIYIAIQGRQMIYKNAIKSQLKTNPHPLEKYRCNCPISRLEIFKTIFNIKKGDGMWWPNNDTIW